MCGRYFIDPVLAGEALKEAVESLEKRAGAPVKTGEICPGDEAAVFARSKSGKATLFRMKWGWKNAKNRLVINALMDTVRRLTHIGVPVRSRVEEGDGCVNVIVTIPAAHSRNDQKTPR